MSPRLYTKVVFTQQIKRRLRLKTFHLLPVKSKLKLEHLRTIMSYSRRQRSSHFTVMSWRNTPSGSFKLCWNTGVSLCWLWCEDLWSSWESGPILAVLQWLYHIRIFFRENHHQNNKRTESNVRMPTQIFVQIFFHILFLPPGTPGQGTPGKSSPPPHLPPVKQCSPFLHPCRPLVHYLIVLKL